MGRQLSRPFFPNSFFCLFIPCFIRLEGQSVDRTVREWSVGRSVGRWFCPSDSHKLGQKVSVSVSWLVHRIVNLSMVNVK